MRIAANQDTMTTYIVAQIKIRDRDEYSVYESGFMDVFARFKGRLLAVDEAPDVLEGHWPYTRTVLITFPSKEDAAAWYQSDDYRKLAEHRHAASEADIVLIKGWVDGGAA